MDVDFKMLKGVEPFIKECFQRYGSMNKNDYEVALFHLLMQCDEYRNISDFMMSKKLKTPETKIKRLRYEVELKYGTEDNNILDNRIISILKQSSFKLTSERLQFAIPDKMTRLYLNNILQMGNRFSDSSFNSNIVSITANDLKYLLDIFELKEADRKDIIDKVKKGIIESCEGLPQTGKERIIKFGKIIIGIIAGKACEKLLDEGIKEISAIIKK